VKLFDIFFAKKDQSRKRGRLVLPPKEYQELLQRVRIRDKYKCRCCKLRRELHGHHVVYRSQGGDDIESNLLSLCDPCHEAVHQRFLTILPREDDAPLDANGPLRMVAQGGWTPGAALPGRKRKKVHNETHEVRWDYR
jgi:hypothetical protein